MGAVSNEAESKIPTVVWGTGNVGRASIRAVTANPALELVGVIVANPEKVGRDAGDLADLGVHLGVAATDDADAVLAASPGAVVYAASGDIRPDDAVADITRALAAGAVVVTPSVYALYDPKSAPPELRDPVEAAAKAGGGALFVSGIDPGWGNDILPILVSGLAGTIDQIRCQEIFDYTTYEQPDSVRYLIGMGQPMDYEPPMVAPTVPTMVWGGADSAHRAGTRGGTRRDPRDLACAARSRKPCRPNIWGSSRPAPKAHCDSRFRESSAGNP